MKRLEEKEDFDDVIFTDESTIQLDIHRRKCFRKKGAPRKLKYKHKHPQKVHVWAGISKRGCTHIVIFDGILTATIYADMHVWAGISKRGCTHIVIFDGILTATIYADILTASLLPFIRDKYSDGHRLYQDNDPKHTSRYI